MPHMPNYQEFKDAGQGDDRDVVDIYDGYYGTYQEQPPAVAGSNMPSDSEPDPFTLTSK